MGQFEVWAKNFKGIQYPFDDSFSDGYSENYWEREL